MQSKYLCTVIGSQNTGKSTFIGDVISKYENNEVFEPFVTDKCDYRKVIEEKNLSINRSGNLESQRVIFDCLSNQIISAIRNPNYLNVIFDRSPIDAWVYTRYLFDKGKINKQSMDQMAYEMLKFAQLYDTIIYIPLQHCNNVVVVDDKFRDTNAEYRQYVDKLFGDAINYLDEHTASKIIEIYGTREERVSMFYNLCHQDFILKDSWLNTIK